MTPLQQLRLNSIESMAHEYLLTSPARLPAALRYRLLMLRQVAASVSVRFGVLDQLEPFNVMFIPARFTLFGAVVSLTSSVVLVLANALKGASADRFALP